MAHAYNLLVMPLIVFGIILIILKPSSRRLWLWTIFWLFVLYLAWYPDSFDYLLELLRMERLKALNLGMEFLLIYISILFIIILIFSMDSRLNRITREIMHLLAHKEDTFIEKVSLIAPAWNEADNIRGLTEELVNASKLLPMEWEVLLVNDGSLDDTGKICDEMAKQYSQVRAVHHKVNKGKTAALETGARESRGDIVVLIESDRQYDPRDLINLLHPFKEGFDFVNGWRLVRSDKFHRRLLSGTYNWFLRSLFETPFRDHNSGYKAFKKETILSVLNTLNRVHLGGPHRLFLVMGEKLGYRGAEMPVQHFGRTAGQSYINPFKTPLGTLKDLLKIRLLLSYRKKKLLGSNE